MKKYNISDWIKPISEALGPQPQASDPDKKLKDRLRQLSRTKTQPLIQKYANTIISKLPELKKTKTSDEILNNIEDSLTKFKNLEKSIKSEDIDKFNKLTALIASANSSDVETIKKRYSRKNIQYRQSSNTSSITEWNVDVANPILETMKHVLKK
jgi:hypothetical protein